MLGPSHEACPPFPSDLPTAGLLSISLGDLQENSSSESGKLFAACQDLGFFYLDLTESDLGKAIIDNAEHLHLLQQQFYSLPHESKDDFGQDKVDPFFAYRWTGCEGDVKDAWGRPGRREMYSMRADDFIGVRSPPLPAHPLVVERAALFTSFARDCRQVVQLILSNLERSLRLPSGVLANLHDHTLLTGDFITLQHRPHEDHSELQVRKGEHTDFGSITMLFNWLGGLQIRDQSSSDGSVGDWVYVKPIPGSCIINLADSLVRFTAGILKSNIHRVAPAPGLQAGLPRYSLVYFAHPNDDVQLVPVKGGMVDEAVREAVDDGIRATAQEWVVRRSLGDLRGVYTYKGGIERRELNDAVRTASTPA